MSIIKSVYDNEEVIIDAILKLHCTHAIQLDPTYSKGNFYKGKIKQPKLKYDLYPQSDDVIKANAESLPIENNSLHTIMFDPPFLATKGPSLKKKDNSNRINKRFGVYPTEIELHTFYINALKEFYRILDKNGILIFKCQDKVSSGKQYLSHVFIINEAEKLGFYTKDIFILLAKMRIVADWQKKNQKHCRKFHSYFIVFEKSNKKIKYTQGA